VAEKSAEPVERFGPLVWAHNEALALTRTPEITPELHTRLLVIADVIAKHVARHQRPTTQPAARPKS
jgi:hypothetical protein